MNQTVPERIEVPGFLVDITPMTAEDVVALVLSRPTEVVRVANINVRGVQAYHHDADFRAHTDEAQVVLADGFPIWRALHQRHPQYGREYRVGSSDWVFALLDADPDLRVVAIGASPASARAAARSARERAPRITWLGYDGYRLDPVEPGQPAWQDAVADADLVLVGMGMPAQERWIRANAHRMTHGVVANVGGCLDYLSGDQAHTPRWIGRLGFEWAYRLVRSPRKIAPRVTVEPLQVLATVGPKNLVRALQPPPRTWGSAPSPVAGPARVAVVVVTWNRRDLLVECLDALAVLDHPAQVIVVDNDSTDGTTQVLAARDDITVVTARTNRGGAAGFAQGLDVALERDVDAVWLMDDDCVPHPSALRHLVEAWQSYPGPRPGLVAGRVEWTDGDDHPMNTPRPKPGARADEVRAARAVGCVPIRTASFVSVLVDAQLARRVGLPVADYFIWNDDFEYTARLTREAPGLYCPASVVVHKTTLKDAHLLDPGPRFYYEVRNKVWAYRTSSFAPREKALYVGASLRRWARTLAASRDRAAVLRGLRDGLRDGVRTTPADTAAVLRDTY